ncbi:MAG: hypothetical protein EZS28_040431 [Streblomastix strix]|uniref:Uncharacterized protein n=1 Tax=Streblomastix strix TaxID=222440 RepID=A0A5J4U217_9EUKA|nr:MAG: hypothetical protein EZS28_040431 [Streblomastix strix]
MPPKIPTKFVQPALPFVQKTRSSSASNLNDDNKTEKLNIKDKDLVEILKTADVMSLQTEKQMIKDTDQVKLLKRTDEQQLIIDQKIDSEDKQLISEKEKRTREKIVKANEELTAVKYDYKVTGRAKEY